MRAVSELSTLYGRAGRWMTASAGPTGDVVVSTRMRLARNLAGYPFPNRAADPQRRAVAELLLSVIEQIRDHKPDFLIRLDLRDELTRRFLHERHLISAEHASGNGAGRAAVFAEHEAISVMINEEDHLRIQAVRSGLQVGRVRRLVELLDRAITDHVEVAFHDRFGYLTACPTNVGTGMRAGAMLHLPALFINRHVEKVVQAANKMGMVVRGAHGEGSAPHGHLFQISNQQTIGKSEDTIFDELSRLIPKVVDYERRMRDVLLEESRIRIEDRIHRSLGLLRSARMVGVEEAMNHLSDLRLGVSLGIVSGAPLNAINELFVLIQAANLRRARFGDEPSGDADDGGRLDQERAQLIRERLPILAPERN
jgi:protein arginine kinase